MSLRYEQRQSLLRTREFLYQLLDPRKTPRVPRSIRQEAGRCLRHYPMLYPDGTPLWSKDPFSASPYEKL